MKAYYIKRNKKKVFKKITENLNQPVVDFMVLVYI